MEVQIELSFKKVLRIWKWKGFYPFQKPSSKVKIGGKINFIGWFLLESVFPGKFKFRTKEIFYLVSSVSKLFLTVYLSWFSDNIMKKV